MFDNSLFTEASPQLQQTAVLHIDDLLENKRVTKKQAQAMKLLATESVYSNAFAHYVLSSEPAFFRADLGHNLLLVDQLREHGVDLGTYFRGVEVEPLKIDITQIKDKIIHGPYAGLDDKISFFSTALKDSLAKLNQLREQMVAMYDKCYEDHTTLVHLDTGDQLTESDIIDMSDYEYADLRQPFKVEFDIDTIEDSEEAINERVDQLSEYANHLSRFAQSIRFFFDDSGYLISPSSFVVDQVAENNQLRNHLKTLGYDLDSEEDEILLEDVDFCHDAFKFLAGPLDQRAEALESEIYSLSEPVLNLAGELSDVYDAVGDISGTKKLAKYDSVKYTVELEKMSPADVLIGNDSGCCYGIYEKILNDTDTDFPFLQLDESIRFFGVYQHRGNTKKRVGMVMAFTCIDNENKPVLTANSLELSKLNNPLLLEVLNPVVDYVHNCLAQYANVAGFSGVAMGGDSHNTSINYGTDKLEAPDHNKTSLTKLPITQTPHFFQEILNRDKEGVYRANQKWKWIWQKQAKLISS